MFRRKIFVNRVGVGAVSLAADCMIYSECVLALHHVNV